MSRARGNGRKLQASMAPHASNWAAPLGRLTGIRPNVRFRRSARCTTCSRTAACTKPRLSSRPRRRQSEIHARPERSPAPRHPADHLRTHARAVVIGGGVGGASILYWLARLGWTETVLVERARVTSGSTFHSAGLVGQLRGSLSLTRMMMNSVDLYRNLSRDVGLETGWREVGSLRLASSAERMEELARQAGWAKTFGLPLELMSAEEAQRLFPPMSTDGVLGARVPAYGRLHRPEPADVRAHRGRRGLRGDARHGHRGRRRRGLPGRHRQRPDRNRARRQRRWDVRARDRPDGRSRGAHHPHGARVPDHQTLRAAARHADDARPFAARLFPSGVGWPRHGRL
jgi:FAD dependent oxidoreductase